MGSSFQAYGIVLLLSLRYGQPWLAKRRVSQEYLDSWMILAWGVVTTFSMHNGQLFVWFKQKIDTYGDFQHSEMNHIGRIKTCNILAWVSFGGSAELLAFG